MNHFPKQVDMLHKELDLIQACIKKYDDRSLLIKGWSIALVGLIIGLNSESILIFDKHATPMALSVLLAVNFLFHTMDIENQKKKWQYVALYKWTVANRAFDDQPWTYVYDLDYTRFRTALKDFKRSDFSKAVYNTIWLFIFLLMAWHTLAGIVNSDGKQQHSTTVTTSDPATGKATPYSHFLSTTLARYSFSVLCKADQAKTNCLILCLPSLLPRVRLHIIF